jgi:hypothetical protein
MLLAPTPSVSLPLDHNKGSERDTIVRNKQPESPTSFNQQLLVPSNSPSTDSNADSSADSSAATQNLKTSENDLSSVKLEGKCVVHVSATWCRNCHNPLYKKMLGHLESMYPQLKTFYIDADKDASFLDQHDISTALPATLFFNDGVYLRDWTCSSILSSSIATRESFMRDLMKL